MSIEGVNEHLKPNFGSLVIGTCLQILLDSGTGKPTMYSNFNIGDSFSKIHNDRVYTITCLSKIPGIFLAGYLHRS